MNRIIKTLLIVETTAVLIPFAFAQTSTTGGTSGGAGAGAGATSSGARQSSTLQTTNSQQGTGANLNTNQNTSQTTSTTRTAGPSQFSSTQTNSELTGPSGATLGAGSAQQNSRTTLTGSGAFSQNSFQSSSGIPGQNPNTFRGEVSTVTTGPIGTGAVDATGFGLTSTPTGDMLTGVPGNTSMIPADFGSELGVERQRQYTPEYNLYVRSRMNGRQIMGPMSVVHTGAAPLKPQVLIVNDILHEGLNHKVSGGMIMEARGADQVALNTQGTRSYSTLAVNRDVIRRNLAVRQPVAPM